MTQEKFEALVRRLEAFAKEHPGQYALRVGALAGLGYLYIAGVLAGLLAVNGVVLLASVQARNFLLAVKVGIPLLALTGTVARAMWVRFPEPKGIVLDRASVPRLFAQVEEVRRALRAAPADVILLTQDFNAGVADHPRVGLFGTKRFLVIGLPLLQALTPAQFRAVLAHEFGHVSANHGRFSSWIYRVRQAWSQLLARFEGQRRWGAGIFVRFARWYAPLFNAYSFVLARAHEYEADRAAAEVAGPQVVAMTLLQMAVKGRQLEQSLWPAVFKQIESAPEPPPNPFAAAGQLFAAPLDSQVAQKCVVSALSVQTGYQDTHPSLRDRLGALGLFAETPPGEPVKALVVEMGGQGESAARELLGPAYATLAERLGRAWQEQVAPKWRERHQYLTQIRESLIKLEEKARAQSLDDGEKWSRAAWTAELQGGEAALPLLQEVLAADPQHVSANYLLGGVLLSRDDPAGIEYVERAMAGDPETVIPGCESIFGFFLRQGQAERAREYERRAIQQQELLAQARVERSGVSSKDTFLPHGLSREQVEAVARQLTSHLQLKRATLVRKQVRIFPEKPFFVLGVVRRQHWFEMNAQRKDTALVEQIASQVLFPGYTWVIILNKSNRKLRRAFEKLPGSAIYDARYASGGTKLEKV